MRRWPSPDTKTPPPAPDEPELATGALGAAPPPPDPPAPDPTIPPDVVSAGNTGCPFFSQETVGGGTPAGGRHRSSICLPRAIRAEYGASSKVFLMSATKEAKFALLKLSSLLRL